MRPGISEPTPPGFSAAEVIRMLCQMPGRTASHGTSRFHGTNRANIGGGDVWSHHRQAAVQSGSVVIFVLVSICFNGSGGILHFTFHIDVSNLILRHYYSL